MAFTFGESNTFRNVGIGTTDNKIIIMNVSKSKENLSFHSTTNDTSVDIMSIKTILNKDDNDELNISGYDGQFINPIIKINNTNQEINITSNLNIARNLNVAHNVVINGMANNDEYVLDIKNQDRKNCVVAIRSHLDTNIYDVYSYPSLLFSQLGDNIQTSMGLGPRSYNTGYRNTNESTFYIEHKNKDGIRFAVDCDSVDGGKEMLFLDGNNLGVYIRQNTDILGNLNISHNLNIDNLTITHNSISTNVHPKEISFLNNTLTDIGLVKTNYAEISNTIIYNGFINNTVIGNVTPNTGKFTTLTTSSNLNVDGNLNINSNLNITGTASIDFNSAELKNIHKINTSNNTGSMTFDDNGTTTIQANVSLKLQSGTTNSGATDIVVVSSTLVDMNRKAVIQPSSDIYTNDEFMLHIKPYQGKDCRVCIESDMNNNSGESHNPSLIFKQDGGGVKMEQGLNANNQFYFFHPQSSATWSRFRFHCGSTETDSNGQPTDASLKLSIEKDKVSIYEKLEINNNQINFQTGTTNHYIKYSGDVDGLELGAYGNGSALFRVKTTDPGITNPVIFECERDKTTFFKPIHMSATATIKMDGNNLLINNEPVNSSDDRRIQIGKNSPIYIQDKTDGYTIIQRDTVEMMTFREGQDYPIILKENTAFDKNIKVTGDLQVDGQFRNVSGFNIRRQYSETNLHSSNLDSITIRSGQGWGGHNQTEHTPLFEFKSLFYSRVTMRATSDGHQCDLHIDGNVFASGGGQLSSDDRFKTNEIPLTNCLQTIIKLQPEFYTKTNLKNMTRYIGECPTYVDDDGVTQQDIDNWPKENYTGKTSSFLESGLIAQDTYNNAPELRHLVSIGVDALNNPENFTEDNKLIENVLDSNGIASYLGINYVGIIPYLIGAVKEMSSKINNLETELNNLKSQ